APREVVPAAAGLFGRVRRGHFVWRTERPTGWGELARELAERPQVLCIVNLKRHARELVARLSGLGAEGVLHVSTNLCPAHRQKVLAEVRRRLENGEPCRLVATQCVEAGVDLDFPVAYRALAPLEAIAQAAGRCNRNGRLAELGEVVVFRPAAEEGELLYPPGEYCKAASATEALLTAAGPAGLDLEDPETFRRYFRAFYELSKCTENWQKLHEALQALDFEALAREYRLIEQDAINVLVPYDIGEFERLRGEVAARGWLTAELRRRLQPHVVSLYRPKQGKDVWQVLEPLPAGRGEASEEWFVLVRPEAYDPELLGFLELEASWIA
ncbi:MAG TPA: CRISPR-associated helicase/endonuclease Cas3, partial [Thermoanaerobaculia bacterium]|nr:CRISPR-associated helicase/endonuclease Cas3 [Thermoanaerobaculia bacterium]